MPLITRESFVEEDVLHRHRHRPSSNRPAEKEGPSRFADLQGKLKFVQAGDDPFNNAVDFSSMAQERQEAAEIMPDGFDDTLEARNTALQNDPKCDNLLLAPVREEIEEFLEASHDLFTRQQALPPTGARRLGIRSHWWPALAEEDYEQDDSQPPPVPRTSYADFYRGVEFDKRVERANLYGCFHSGENVASSSQNSI
jgi:hypothetical protein